ncbi:hypothetical protein EJ08DRAFT_732088 [Tothia fuscella]|uniref:Uncharacterized protein n=1 Tax=Tothia fuscella TaxID=1048955 RepID=A0A9P4NWR3_9PEZI|nr:hypothetical protein EJ08DRAFT_732088 [Tothia fuscella]
MTRLFVANPDPTTLNTCRQRHRDAVHASAQAQQLRVADESTSYIPHPSDRLYDTDTLSFGGGAATRDPFQSPTRALVTTKPPRHQHRGGALYTSPLPSQSAAPLPGMPLGNLRVARKRERRVAIPPKMSINDMNSVMDSPLRKDLTQKMDKERRETVIRNAKTVWPHEDNTNATDFAESEISNPFNTGRYMSSAEAQEEIRGGLTRVIHGPATPDSSTLQTLKRTFQYRSPADVDDFMVPKDMLRKKQEGRVRSNRDPLRTAVIFDTRSLVSPVGTSSSSAVDFRKAATPGTVHPCLPDHHLNCPPSVFESPSNPRYASASTWWPGETPSNPHYASASTGDENSIGDTSASHEDTTLELRKTLFARTSKQNAHKKSPSLDDELFGPQRLQSGSTSDSVRGFVDDRVNNHYPRLQQTSNTSNFRNHSISSRSTSVVRHTSVSSRRADLTNRISKLEWELSSFARAIPTETTAKNDGVAKLVDISGIGGELTGTKADSNAHLEDLAAAFGDAVLGNNIPIPDTIEDIARILYPHFQEDLDVVHYEMDGHFFSAVRVTAASVKGPRILVQSVPSASSVAALVDLHGFVHEEFMLRGHAHNRPPKSTVGPLEDTHQDDLSDHNDNEEDIRFLCGQFLQAAHLSGDDRVSDAVSRLGPASYKHAVAFASCMSQVRKVEDMCAEADLISRMEFLKACVESGDLLVRGLAKKVDGTAWEM